MSCVHKPKCPPVEEPDNTAARTLATHHEQGWSLLCNGLVVFDDGGQMSPSGQVTPACRAAAPHAGQIATRPLALAH